MPPRLVHSAFQRILEVDLGECPIWDERRALLWFVDILKPALWSFDPASKATKTYPMPCEIGSIGLTEDDRLIVALRSGVHLFDPQSSILKFLVQPEPDRTMNRLNDGRVGPDGCFWVGSMHDSTPRQPTGALYRVTPHGGCERILDGLCISNGLAWSPDNRSMYHADSHLVGGGGEIRVYDFDKRTGHISGGRLFASLTHTDGLPDGAAVDVEGYYWSAGVTAGVLNRFAPDGTLVTKISVPTTAPTMPCFADDERGTLFLTALTRDGASGCLMHADSSARGLPEYRFATSEMRG